MQFHTNRAPSKPNKSKNKNILARREFLGLGAQYLLNSLKNALMFIWKFVEHASSMRLSIQYGLCNTTNSDPAIHRTALNGRKNEKLGGAEWTSSKRRFKCCLNEPDHFLARPKTSPANQNVSERMVGALAYDAHASMALAVATVCPSVSVYCS